jgi:starch synthase
MPFHGTIDRANLDLTRLADGIEVPWPDGPQRASLWRTPVRGVPVYLVENARFFGRERVYGYDDDNDRFLFLCDALLACAGALDFAPDAIHAHDWHAALAFTRLAAGAPHPWKGCGRVYTIHNLALQGSFDGGWAAHHGIGDRELAPPDGLPGELALSCMAQGILHAGRVNTVSRTYAREITTPEYGAGLDGLLRARSGALSGIVNGIDYEEFDPRTDPHLARHYDADSITLRTENKRALQREAGLPEDDGTPLFGAVTRLWAQKGMDLAAAAFDALLSRHDAQLIVLGTGDEAVHEQLLALQSRFPDRVKIWLDFDPPLGQRIYAGCDIFLMPSRYEPCGLGQLISLRYGAVPLVRRTGGLVDTVEDASADLRTGTGFVFDDATAPALEQACERAAAAYANRDGWRAMQERGMRQDWSWGRAAGEYIELYEAAHSPRTAAERA